LILRYIESGRHVLRDLEGEELYQVIRDRTSKKGSLKDELLVFKGYGLAVGEKIAVSKGAEERDGFPWTLSTDMKDRHGDIVKQNFILDFYKMNPVLLWAHNHSIPAIGYMEDIAAGESLKGVAVFNGADIDPFAAGIKGRVLAGSIRAGSVGFMPNKIDPIEEEIEGKHYITGFELSENELWEFSICNVPANPMALAEFGKPEGKKAVKQQTEEAPKAYWPGLSRSGS